MSYVLRPPTASRFVRTSIFEQVKVAVDFTLTMRAPSLIVGQPGIGKTTSLRHLTEHDSKSAYVMIGNGQRTLRSLFRSIITAFEWPHYHRNNEDLGEVVYHNLPASVERGHYLLIDEVQTLDLNALRELLNFHEICGLPMVLSGNQSALKRTRVDSYVYEQIRSRIWKTVTLKSPVRDDFIAVGVEHNVEGKDAYEALVVLGLQTSIRHVVQVLESAREISGESGSIKLESLREAVAFLTDNGTRNIHLASPGLRETFV